MSHTKESLFLLDGMRFKLSFHDIYCEECGAEHDKVTVEPLGMYANELHGKWVALVPAENDRHLEILNLKRQRDELLSALEAGVSNLGSGGRVTWIENARAIIARVKARTCSNCEGRGVVGGHVGQTPEQFDYVEEPCTTCGGTGEIDETLGGEFFSNPHAPCPDCKGSQS